MSGNSRLIQGLAWSMAGLAIFSGWMVVTRLVMTADLRVWDVIALRYGGGTLVLLPVLLGQCARLPWRAWREGIVLGCLWGAPFVLAVAFGLRLTSVAHASSITPGLMPIFAGGFAWALLGERPTPARLAGYGVILAGVGLLLWASSGPGAGISVVGLMALVAAAAIWGAYPLRLSRSGLTSIQAASLVCFWSAAAFLPVYVLAGLSYLSRASFGEVAFQALYQGVLMSGVAILAFNRAVALLGPVAAAAIIALVPAVATGVAGPVLGEAPSTTAWAAIGMIGCGVILAAAIGRSIATMRRRNPVTETSTARP
ncbi:MAG: DMT family transporter [Acetobacteraceae bacterium]